MLVDKTQTLAEELGEGWEAEGDGAQNGPAAVKPWDGAFVACVRGGQGVGGAALWVEAETPARALLLLKAVWKTYRDQVDKALGEVS